MIPKPSRRLSTLSFAAWLSLLGACDAQQAPPTPSASASASVPSPASAAAVGNASAAHEQLAKMDPRRPVPLQPMMAWHQKQNMMEHLVAVQRITEALSREDWDGVAEAAKLIESSPRMQQMCRHMGSGAEGFTELALDFHRRADAIGVAAKAKDGKAVLQATSNTLQACTSCHAAYRQDVVDAATWEARTGAAHDPAMMHGEH